MKNRPSAQPLAIGIDLGASKIAAALVDPDGHVVTACQVPTDSQAGQEFILDRIAGLIDQLIESAENQILAGIGIGSPGEVDATTGIVRNAVNLGWGEVNLVEEIHQRIQTQAPIYVRIDTHASLLGEHLFGAGRGCSNLAYIAIGSGLGGGFMVDGRLVDGANHAAAMIGHWSLDPDGWPCRCGNRGCAETVVSGPGLVRMAKHFSEEGRISTALDFSQELDPPTIVRAAQAGDALALAAVAELGIRLGIVLSACAALLNPERIVIGGGLGLAAFDLLLPYAQAEFERRTLPVSRAKLEILPSSLRSPSIGASALAWYDHGYTDS